MRRVRELLGRAVALLVVGLPARQAHALDKQGSAHGGAVSSEESPENAFDVSGSLTLGVSLINNSYGARPDNTGLALMRYAGHADVDLIGRKLSIPIDVNMFSDKTKHGLAVFAPTELDLTYEVIGHLAPFELHLAYERDMPLDTRSLVQDFVYALLVWDFDLKGPPTPIEPRAAVPSP